MKIKISRPDGSIIEADGTPEECASLLGIATAGPKEEPSLEEIRKLLQDAINRPAPIWVSPYVYPWWYYSTPPTYVIPPTYPTWTIPSYPPTWTTGELTIDPNVPCTGIFVGDPPSTIRSASTVSLPSLVSQPTFSISFNDQAAGAGFSTSTLMLSADS